MKETKNGQKDIYNKNKQKKQKKQAYEEKIRNKGDRERTDE